MEDQNIVEEEEDDCFDGGGIRSSIQQKCHLNIRKA